MGAYHAMERPVAGLVLLLSSLSIVGGCDDDQSSEIEADGELHLIYLDIYHFEGEGLEIKLTAEDEDEVLKPDLPGAHDFETELETATEYEVEIVAQPVNPQQTCELPEPEGVVEGRTAIDVKCVTEAYPVGGHVEGLQGAELELHLNNEQTVTLDADGEYEFEATVPDSEDYRVRILEQPTGPLHECGPMDIEGTIDQAPVEDADFTCELRHFEVQGTVDGLEGDPVTVGLEWDEGTEELSLEENGEFSFDPALPDQTEFEVNVLAEPEVPSQQCSVQGGSGQIDEAHHAELEISCVTRSFEVRGSLEGLEGDELVLELTGPGSGQELALSSNGEFSFPQPLRDLSDFEVQASAHPGNPSQTCEVYGGEGQIGGAHYEDVQVQCTTDEFEVGGSVNGLEGEGLQLEMSADSGGQHLDVSENGSFEFGDSVPDHESFSVEVANQPAGPVQDCQVTNGTGQIDGASYMDIEVDCVTEEFAVGGQLTGYDSTDDLVIELSGGTSQSLSLSSNGSFEFPDPLPDQTEFAVSIESQPDGIPVQDCEIDGADSFTDSLEGQDYLDLDLQCEDKLFDVEVSAPDLEGDRIIVSLDGTNRELTPSNNTRTYSAAIPSHDQHQIDVVEGRPDEPNQICDGDAPHFFEVNNRDDNPVEVTVDCETKTYPVRVRRSGDFGNGLRVEMSGEELSLDSNITRTFNTEIKDHDSYSVQKVSGSENSSGRNQECLLSNASGMISGGAEIVDVDCRDAYDVSGTVIWDEFDECPPGEVCYIPDDASPSESDTRTDSDSPVVAPAGSTVSIRLSGGRGTRNVSRSGSDTAFNFSESVGDGRDYSLSIASQPGDWTCHTSASGTIDGSNASGNSVTCFPDNNTFTDFYRINDELVATWHDGQRRELTIGSSRSIAGDGLVKGQDFARTEGLAPEQSETLELWEQDDDTRRVSLKPVAPRVPSLGEVAAPVFAAEQCDTDGQTLIEAYPLADMTPEEMPVPNEASESTDALEESGKKDRPEPILDELAFWRGEGRSLDGAAHDVRTAWADSAALVLAEDHRRIQMVQAEDRMTLDEDSSLDYQVPDGNADWEVSVIGELDEKVVAWDADLSVRHGFFLQADGSIRVKRRIVDILQTVAEIELDARPGKDAQLVADPAGRWLAVLEPGRSLQVWRFLAEENRLEKVRDQNVIAHWIASDAAGNHLYLGGPEGQVEQYRIDRRDADPVFVDEYRLPEATEAPVFARDGLQALLPTAEGVFHLEVDEDGRLHAGESLGRAEGDWLGFLRMSDDLQQGGCGLNDGRAGK